MKIRVVGYVDKIIELDQEESDMYEEAKSIGKLASFMDPYLSEIVIDLTYEREEEFNGSQV